jgi:hypothetical protein
LPILTTTMWSKLEITNHTIHRYIYTNIESDHDNKYNSNNDDYENDVCVHPLVNEERRTGRDSCTLYIKIILDFVVVYSVMMNEWTDD